MSQNYRALLLAQINAEFNGNSFNGPNLIKTLETISFGDLGNTNTYDEYSVIAIVLHIIFWKIAFTKGIGGTSTIDLPYKGDNWPTPPTSLTHEIWNGLLVALKQSHAEQIVAIEQLAETALDQDMAWGCSNSEAIAWIATHDTYHNAQIRNMGLPASNFVNHPE